MGSVQMVFNVPWHYDRNNPGGCPLSANPTDTPDSPDSPDTTSNILPRVVGSDALEELRQILKTVPDHQHSLIVDAARQAAALLASRPDEATPGTSSELS